MISRLLSAVLLMGGVVPAVVANESVAAVEVVAQTHEATTPAHRNQIRWWKHRHAQKLQAAKTAKCDILFVGDSITQMWERHGAKVWQKYYGDRNAFNIGYSGDQTQHVLWRLDQGEMDHFKPKVAVLMIGTNNTGHQKNWTAQKVADGVRAIIGRIHAKSPDTEVLLLAVFPRGATADDPMRVRNDEINALIQSYGELDKVHFLDLAPKFLDAEGNLPKSVMPDLLHPHAAGYEIWADAMEPTLQRLLEVSKAPGAALNSAVVPVPKLENDFYDWYQRHDEVKALAAEGNPELVFIGDSITHMFGGEPKSRIARGAQVWGEFYQPRNTINLGFGWDRTQNMLWRIENGEFDGLKPKVAVVMAGTNNLTGTQNARANTPEEIFEGVEAICTAIHQRSPDTEIVLIGVLPRLQAEMNPKIQKLNGLIEGLDAQSKITVLNLWDRFCDPSGEVNKALFQDAVHPNAAGYRVWAEAMEPTLEQLLQ
ncbi:GDSL-type esterase/lipase family protein [Sulfuriroseicoccus oceanibius]|uniref:SGNH hydrolase-type esterase domain-containing protein n=1 Tax=Sulfuriroseicoccus oceanibius TaxID=2707525 RepID=A0A6B3L7V8_9BACT|nr:GDSL-type esterase/lipase family protein [Sulfuriroseicoccus oceanibius]QQL45312.1 hypothetical protein G3M56_001615 [Sulfuriroseicoccus oceanibius]